MNILEKISRHLVAAETSDLEKAFDYLAEELFTSYTLLTESGEKYSFSELEFYAYSCHHQDGYCHQRPEQKKGGFWYRHPAGLDLTAGNDGMHLGILIRGLKRLGDGTFISGPLNVRSELEKANGGRKILSAIIDNGPALVQHPKVDRQYFKSSRFGLSKKNHQFASFRGRPYRFVADICPAHQFKAKTIVAEHIRSAGRTTAEVNCIFGWRILK